MENNKDLSEYKEKIYLITKNIISERLPDKLYLFELGWGNAWNKICKLKDKDPREWKIEDLEETPSGVFSYPTDEDNQEVKAITLTATAIGAELIGAKRELSTEEKEEIVNTHIEQFSLPEYARQKLLSVFLETGKSEKTSSESKTDTPQATSPRPKEPLPAKEEKKEYNVYSHEYPHDKPLTKNGYRGRKAEISPNKRECFLYLSDIPPVELYMNGEPLKIFGNERKLLKLLIKKAGSPVSHSEISKKIFGIDLDNLIDDDTIKKHIGNIHTLHSHLKKKCSRDLKNCFETVHGKGYMICFGKDERYYLFEPIRVT